MTENFKWPEIWYYLPCILSELFNRQSFSLMFVLKPTQQNLIGLVEHLTPQSMFDIVFHYELESMEPDGDEAVGVVRTISFPQGSNTSTVKSIRGGGLSSSPQTPQTPTRTRPSIIPKRDDHLQTGILSVPGTSMSCLTLARLQASSLRSYLRSLRFAQL
jgi:hypothetical protein